MAQSYSLQKPSVFGLKHSICDVNYFTVLFHFLLQSALISTTAPGLDPYRGGFTVITMKCLCLGLKFTLSMREWNTHTRTLRKESRAPLVMCSTIIIMVLPEGEQQERVCEDGGVRRKRRKKQEERLRWEELGIVGTLSVSSDSTAGYETLMVLA